MKMKRLVLFPLVYVFATAPSDIYAAEESNLGDGNITVKLDYINFSDDVVKNSDTDRGLYVGIEGFTEIKSNLYLGMELGYTNPDGTVNILGTDVNTELTFVPIELNLKYVVEAAPNLLVDFGAGVSSSYVEEEAFARGVSNSADDWLFGGQICIDLSYKFDRLFIGINGKYQLTEDFKDFDYDYSNWRIGGQIGFMF